MKRLLSLLGVFLVVLFAVGFAGWVLGAKSGSTQRIEDPSVTPSSSSGSSSSASWAYPFVRWNDRNYATTTTPVKSVGKQIGSVTTYSDREGNYTGTFSNYYQVGTKLFEIPNVDSAKVIAVQVGKDSYFEAVVR